MALSGAAQAEGTAGRLEWKARSPLLAGRRVAVLPPLRGGLQAALGCFSTDSPLLFPSTARFPRQLRSVTPEPQKTQITAFQRQLRLPVHSTG